MSEKMFAMASFRADNNVTEDEFIARLAEFANQYVDDVALPIMCAAHELYESDAIVALVYRWYESSIEYKRGRIRHLVQMADYDPTFPPYQMGEWAKREANAYEESLRTLLIR